MSDPVDMQELFDALMIRQLKEHGIFEGVVAMLYAKQVEIKRLREALQRLAKLEEFVGGEPSCIEEVMNYTQHIARAALGEGK